MDEWTRGSLLTPRSLRFQFGRCSVRKFYPMALEILKANIPLFEGFVEHRIALDDAEEVSSTRRDVCSVRRLG